MYKRQEIRSFLKNIGYTRFPSVDGKEFFFSGRTSELDDLFYNENIVLIVESVSYTHLDVYKRQ